MKRFLIFLGMFLLATYVLRSCIGNETKELVAYGFAHFNKTEQTIVIHDELDSLQKTKTYVTSYAQLGLLDEKLDWNKKVYVYVTDGYVALISNTEYERSVFLLNYMMKVAAYDFFHSYKPWFLGGICLLLVGGYRKGYQLVLKDNPKGRKIVNYIWGFGFGVLILNFFSFFSFLAETKDTPPVYVTVTDDKPNLILDVVVSDQYLIDKNTKFVYDWGDYYLVTFNPLRDEDVPLLCAGYKKQAGIIVDLYIITLLMVFFYALNRLAAIYNDRIAKQMKGKEQNAENEPSSVVENVED